MEVEMKHIKILKVYNQRNEYLIGQIAQVKREQVKSINDYNCIEVLTCDGRTILVAEGCYQKVDSENVLLFKISA